MPCWKGNECNTPDNRKPRFTSTFYEFTIDPVNLESAENLAGELFATDADNIKLECGQLQFAISERPMKTNILLVDPESGQVRWNKSHTVQHFPLYVMVTVRNPVPFDQLYDTAVILVREGNLSTVRKNEAENVNHEVIPQILRRTKRGLVSPPSETQATIQNISDSASKVICNGCFMQAKVTVTLPFKTTTLSIHLLGPTTNDSYMGYVEDVTINNTGIGISSAVSCVRSIQVSNGTGMSSIGLDCSSITVNKPQGTSMDDFSFDLLYKNRVINTAASDTILDSGFTVIDGDNLIIGILEIVVGPRVPNFVMSNCPTETVLTGSVTKVAFELFAPVALGDYTIHITSSDTSLVILDTEIFIGQAFTVRNDTVIKRTWNQYGKRLITCSQMKFQLVALENANSMDAGWSDPKHSISINVYTQVSPLATSNATIEVHILFPGTSLMLINCPFRISARSDTLKPNPGLIMTSTSPATAVDTHKSVNVTVRLVFAEFSVQSYYLEVELLQKDLAEIGFATVLKTGSKLTEFTVGLRLLTEYFRTGLNSFITKARIYLGFIQNPGPGSSEYDLEIRLGIRALGSTLIQSGDTGSVKITPCWFGEKGTPQEINFVIGTKTIVPILDVNSKPTVELNKFQPKTSDMKSDYFTLLVATVTFSVDVVYGPVEFGFTFAIATVLINSCSVRSVGDCFENFIPVGMEFSLSSVQANFLAPSIYLKCPSSASTRSITFQCVVRPTGLKLLTNFNLLVGNTTVSRAVSSTINGTTVEALVIPSADMYLSNLGGQNRFTMGINLLLAKLIINQSAPADYSVRIYSLYFPSELKFCRPKLSVFDPIMGISLIPVKPSLEVLSFPLGKLFYEADDIQLNSGSIPMGLHQVSFIIPVIYRFNNSCAISTTIAMNYGRLNVTKNAEFVVGNLSATVGVAWSFETQQIELLDFNPFPAASTASLGPGQVGRFTYDIRIPDMGCSNYSVSVTQEPDNLWPMDLSALVHSRGSTIWCMDTWKPPRGMKSFTIPQIMNRVEINLDEVCSQGSSEDWIRVVAYARMWSTFPTSQSAIGSIQKGFQFSLKQNNISIPESVRNVSFTFSSVSSAVAIKTIYTKDPVLNWPVSGKVSATPGVATTFSFFINMSVGSQLPNGNLEFTCQRLTGQKEAQCTFTSCTLTSGFNMAEMQNEPFTPVFASTFNNGQYNVMRVPFETVINTGATITAQTTLADSDVVYADVGVILADSQNAVQGQPISIKATLTFDTGLYTTTGQMIVNRNGSEEVQIKVESSIQGVLDPSGLVYPGNSFNLMVNMTMLPESRMECTRCTLNIHQYYFVEQLKLVSLSGQTNFTPSAAPPAINWFEFTAPGFYFGQNVQVNFSVKMKNEISFPRDMGQSAVLFPVELVCFTYVRSVPPTSNVTQGLRRFLSVAQAQVISSGNQKTCDNDLGMANPLLVKDCQISAFASPHTNYSIRMVRYNSGSGWKTPTRGVIFYQYRYVTVLFGQLTVLTRIELRLVDVTNKIVTVEIFGTMDGRSYFLHEQAQMTYVDDQRAWHILGYPMNARGVRLVMKRLQNENRETAFNLALLGCIKSRDIDAFDPCAVNQYSLAAVDGYLPRPFVWEPRSFLYGNGRFFVCDMASDQSWLFGRRQRCFMIFDTAPQTIVDLGPMVSQVVTYHPSTNTLFAIGMEGQSLLKSTDLGINWTGITLQAYKSIIASSVGAINATAVPWLTIPSQFEETIQGAQCTAYKAGPWNICYGGIYFGSNLTVDWNTGCSAFQPYLNTL
ncbi:hypothetical protein D915_008669 [Fasciola hepatica]|uniref:F5/8 type C domain-containing protein n=1 Tax=Fasciola hepatica TaxID=6192 RepID=A0A4E0R0C6_FASHE|nr:hypothetical protein D915_008669 [Fasciola hepatica]